MFCNIRFYFQMSAISELYKTKGCDPGLKLGLTPLYIAILSVVFSVLVYGNCVVKILQKTTDSGMSIGKILIFLLVYLALKYYGTVGNFNT